MDVARGIHASIKDLEMTAREAGHVAALGRLVGGEWNGAGETLAAVARDFPRDALALQAGHQIDFFTGNAPMLRDRIARVLPAWSRHVPGWHAVLGMQAFGLEETGDYARAERLGREAVELEPRDAWAQHAVAHVLEMQGRRDEGIEWMLGNEGWQSDSFLAVHNWWHLALHHLAQGDVPEVLALYDGPIHGHRPQIHVELVDASALLWRLKLQGADVGQRWQQLAERWAPFAADGHYAFSDWHAAMAFVAAGRDDLLQALQHAQQEAMTRQGDNAVFTREVGAAATQRSFGRVV